MPGSVERVFEQVRQVTAEAEALLVDVVASPDDGAAAGKPTRSLFP